MLEVHMKMNAGVVLSYFYFIISDFSLLKKTSKVPQIFMKMLRRIIMSVACLVIILAFFTLTTNIGEKQ